MLDWPKVAPLPWRARRAAVEAAARELLARSACDPFSTRGLAQLLAPNPNDAQAINAIGAELMKIAPYIGEPWATHDGDTFIAYGKAKKRWRWHGQGIAAPANGAKCFTCGMLAVIDGKCTACGGR